jgi:hypothetical protein
MLPLQFALRNAPHVFRGAPIAAEFGRRNPRQGASPKPVSGAFQGKFLPTTLSCVQLQT